MLLLRFVDGEAKMLSIPRDLYVAIAETGGSAKINAAYNGGPRRLILTVQQALGIPVHHYLEVDFVSFASLVDSLGGVTIDFPNPAFDRSSGLDVQQAGAVELDGPQALAFVRSRHYVEVDRRPGAHRTTPGDLGRVARQQQFLTRGARQARGLQATRSRWPAPRTAPAGGLRIDDTPRPDRRASASGGASAGVDPVPVVLPVDDRAQQRRLGALPRPARGRRRPRPVPLTPRVCGRRLSGLSSTIERVSDN